MELTGKIWRGVYADSIALMQVAEAARRVPGVTSVAPSTPRWRRWRAVATER